MPPALPQSPLTCLVRNKSMVSISSSLRKFSTSSPLASIGPESPKFINIPLPPQRYATGARDIKGKLPPPREIFHRRGPTKNGRTLKKHLALAILEPSEKNQISASKDERTKWKRRMAASRRENLREGIVALHQRKLNQEAAIATRSQRKQKERNERAYAPQREDERLTNPTILEAVRQLQQGPVADPQREIRIVEKKERVKAKELALADVRRDALHTLYMNARSFIVSEEQLNTEVDKIFVPTVGTGGDKGNVWDAFGQQETVQDMLSVVNNTQKGAVENASANRPAILTGKRLKRIAEELTGGKLDSLDGR
ncbi:hypothetical protein B0O99DRAFT_610028 [Bisporella sp. PMI_857]|nr:hypothetical protein B0O99DRAFT_610028 [Bisporella sp. PMI_857]